MNSKYSLPTLPYGYKDLEPYISEVQLTLHHQKHHQAYVNAANTVFDSLENARKNQVDLEMKSTLKTLAFNIGGIVLHNLFWENLKAVKDGQVGSDGQEEPEGELINKINEEFGSFERFKKEFTATALTVEGSGWAALVADDEKKLLCMQIEKHNVNLYPNYKILLVMDVWEHAYYLDYKNDRAKFIEAFWNIVNWKVVSERFEE